tara:strand:- start:24262 stop:24567 length:306 start_codon:yes stop_codon:yes gene_type:complete
MPSKKEILKKIRKMDRPSRAELGAEKEEEEVPVVKITYPSRFNYEGAGGIMRLTGGVKPWEYSDNPRDMDHKRAGDPVSAAKMTEEEKYQEKLREFFEDVD